MKGNFQLILLVIFIAAAIFGVLVFSGVIPLGSDGASGSGTVVLWGTASSNLLSEPLEDFRTANPNLTIKYIEKSVDTFDRDLLEALASGTGPDMFFLTDNLVYSYANKISVIPYTSYPLVTFKNVFAGAGEVFLNSSGMLAFPISIDPMVMYYNRAMFDASGITHPPTTWNDLTDMAPLITKKDESNKIIKSAVALGHYANVEHAKDILATLFMQAGNPIVLEQKGKVGFYNSALGSTTGNYNLPSVLKFYSDFANPSSVVYSWNKSFPNSSDTFSKEDLAIYFGYASELASLVNKNPNQNFFVAEMPQIKNANYKLTKARVTGIAVSPSSKNITAAYNAANLLTSSDFALSFAKATGTVPARRDLLSLKPIDAYSPIFYNSALYAKSWLDPSPKDTDSIFDNMISAVISGGMSEREAIDDASSKMDLLLVREENIETGF